MTFARAVNGDVNRHERRPRRPCGRSYSRVRTSELTDRPRPRTPRTRASFVPFIRARRARSTDRALDVDAMDRSSTSGVRRSPSPSTSFVRSHVRSFVRSFVRRSSFVRPRPTDRPPVPVRSLPFPSSIKTRRCDRPLRGDDVIRDTPYVADVRDARDRRRSRSRTTTEGATLREVNVEHDVRTDGSHARWAIDRT